MNRSWRILLACLLLTGCQLMPYTDKPPKSQEWVAFMHRIDALEPAEIPARREEAVRQYNSRPDDASRMRLSYLLSRPNPSLQQLARSREILAQISSTSELAPFRDLLDREVALLIQLKRNRGRILELEAQLEALKAIEEEMIENRQSMDGEQP